MLERIETEFGDPLGRVLARSLFGDAGPAQVRQALTAFCAEELGSGPAELRFFRMSVGAVFGLRLEDGRAVVVKLHLPREQLDRLVCVQLVQKHLADAGFPCPRPVGEPRTVLGLPATVEEHVGGGEERDAHDPKVRRVMARTLAHLVRLTDRLDDLEGLGEAWTPNAADGLRGEPHNALFDFEATAAGAEWIDELAASAATRSRAGRLVAGHTDWSVKHFRFRGLEVHVIYDWDSLRVESEPGIVAGAAVTFPYTEAFDVPRVASLDELHAFVAEYEEQRLAAFAPAERDAFRAQAVRALAYTARCEHALDPTGRRPKGSYREALAQFGEELLS
jgi:Phosphotransferase enzyme family